MTAQCPQTGSPAVTVRATVNGRPVAVTVPARMTLSDFLRDRLGLTGTHLGCEQGVCGACAVFVDGASVRACLVLAAQVDGAEVVTVEGLQDNPVTAELRQAFSRHHALQCGFCTPGMLVTATELVQCARRSGSCAAVSEATVRETMSGNLCRCTGYQGIVEAVLEVSQDEDTEDDGAQA